MSVSSVSLNTDVNVRYERLAAEYSKLRAQAKVLRDGVLSERSKAEKLAEELKSAEATTRKLQTENESLLFRNEQLVRRVESLQEDVDLKRIDSVKKDKAPKKNGLPKDGMAQLQTMAAKVLLLEEELNNKIRRNEELVTRIAENERQHNEEMAAMSQKLAREYRELEAQLDSMQREQAKRSASFSAQVPSPLQNTDVNQEVLTVESPPPPPASEALLHVAQTVQSTLRGFTNFFNLLQQRSEIYPYDVTMETLPSHVLKLAAAYDQCSKLFSEATRFVDDFVEKSEFEPSVDAATLRSSFALISRHCSTMMPEVLRKMTDEENKVTWSTQQLEQMNRDWVDAILNLFDVFGRISVAVDVWTETKSLEDLLKTISSLSEFVRDLGIIFRDRWVHESRFPTSTKKMRCVGVALSDCLQLLTNETAKLDARTSAVFRLIENEAKQEEETKEEQDRVLQPEENNDVDRAKLNSGQEAYNDANSNRLCDSCAKNLNKSEETKDQKISVEEERADLHVPKIDVIKVEYLRERVNGLQEERDKQQVDISLLKRKLELLSGNEKTTSSEIDHLRDVGRQMTKELLHKVEKAECTWRYYKEECEIILQMNLQLESEKAELENRIQKLEEGRGMIEEELASVRRSYDAQLAQLSDHVAELVAAAHGAEVPKTESPTKEKRSMFKSLYKHK
ncbi:unnamed protein product [Caenorhabditis auriculariae]|uniref:Protein phosphatase 1 regulatory subunit 21 N-terminal domain-containing protein n=1 Tax=Caenorhabditis auriculariae TaxID=2777116 RepID=A0A8S1GUQ2_9PELO|nr:unnamed protein product [Caenorhabditis auriculariae]